MRSVLIILLLCSAPSATWADNTHGLGSEARERAAWFSDGYSGYVSSGCDFVVPASSLELAAKACDGYVNNGQEWAFAPQEAIEITLPSVNGEHWLLLFHDHFTLPAGWAAAGFGTHFRQQQTATQPADPVGGIVFAQVTVAGSVVTAVEEIGYRRIAATETVNANRTVGQAGVWDVRPGGDIAISTGVTLTMNGNLIPRPYSMKSGLGTLAFGAPTATPEIYPQQWGLLGDGTIDQTTWQEVVTAATDGPVLRLTVGTWAGDDTITAFAGSLTVLGMGNTVSILKDIRLHCTGAEGMLFKDFQMLGGDGAMIQADNCSHVIVSGLLFDNDDVLSGARAVQLFDSTDVDIIHNEMIDFQYAIWLRDDNDGPNERVLIQGNVIHNRAGNFASFPAGVNIAEANDVRVIGNHVYSILSDTNNAYGMYIGDSSGFDTRRIIYANNIIEGITNTSGTEYGFNNSNGQQVSYIGNIVRNSGASSIWIRGGQSDVGTTDQRDIVISGNDLEGAIRLEAAVFNVTVSGNVIVGNGNTQGIIIDGGTFSGNDPRYISIMGNTIQLTPKSCIFVTQANYVTISGNTLVDCNTENNASGSSTQNNAGVGIATADFVSITGNIIGNVTPSGFVQHAINVGSIASNIHLTYSENQYVDIDDIVVRNGHIVAPATGAWENGAVVLNSIPDVADGNVGWVNILEGTPGTWAPFNEAGQITPDLFATLGSPANGFIRYCSDCTKATPCAGAGPGAWAKRINGAWDCD